MRVIYGMKQLLYVLCVFLFTVTPLFPGEESQAGGTIRAAWNNNDPVIEKLAVINGFTRQGGKAGAADGPNLLLVDEAAGEIGIPQGTREGASCRGVPVRFRPDGRPAFPHRDGGIEFIGL